MAEEIKHDRRSFLRAGAMSIATASLGVMGSVMQQATAAEVQLPVEGELPSLGRVTGWLNSQPLTAAGLRGKVVLIDFCTYTCINWLRQLPYVRAWSEKYRDWGLVVIGVHTPEFPFEKDVENVRRALKGLKVDFPIATDNDYAIWRAFNNNYWPALYFIDTTGRIRHHHFGEGAYEQSEKTIQKLLSDPGKTTGRDLVSVDGRGVEAAADWSSLKSPENYLGYERTENFASLDGLSPDKRAASYAAPARLRLNQWALSGDWTVGKQPAVLNEASGKIACRFHARDLHLVMAPSARGKSVRFRVLIDGQPPGAARGIDIDPKGNGILAEPRMYQLIRQPKPITDRQFEIEFVSPGMEAFAFTFG